MRFSVGFRPGAKKVALTGAVGLALALAGCGGSSSTTTASTATGTTATGASAKGEDLFKQNCGACHVLSSAGTTGKVGPSLDATKLTVAAVEDKIAKPTGSMPANLVTGADAVDVSEYVSKESQ